MTPRLPRTVRLAAGGLLAALLLSGCGGGPVRAGAAATVGDDRIESAAFTGVVERGLESEEAQEQVGADRAGFQRSVLSRLIVGQLLDEAARREGVEVTEGDVDARYQALAQQLGGQEQLLQQAAASGVAEPDLRAFVRNLALEEALGDALTAGEQVPPAALQQLYQQEIARFDQVLARHILLRTQAEAQQVLREVQADQGKFAGIAEERSLDEGSAARGGQLQPAGRGTFVGPFEEALFAARPGQLGVVQTEFGFHVFQLLERRTTSLADATPELRRAALQEQRGAAIGEALREVAGDVGVTVNPRFGRWDAEQVSVVDAASSLSTPEAGDGPAPEGELPLPEGEQLPEEQAPAEGS